MSGRWDCDDVASQNDRGRNGLSARFVFGRALRQWIFVSFNAVLGTAAGGEDQIALDTTAHLSSLLDTRECSYCPSAWILPFGVRLVLKDSVCARVHVYLMAAANVTHVTKLAKMLAITTGLMVLVVDHPFGGHSFSDTRYLFVDRHRASVSTNSHPSFVPTRGDRTYNCGAGWMVPTLRSSESRRS